MISIHFKSVPRFKCLFNLFSCLFSAAPRKQKIDTGLLKNIVEVDSEQRLVTVEPRLRMVELSHFLLSQGYSVPCVPELDDLTVGGLLMGCGIESTSWKYGMFNEI